MAVRVRGNMLVIDFRCRLPDGRPVRCVESTGLRDSAGARKLAVAKDKAIAYHLGAGYFDYLKFFPHGSKARHFDRARQDMPLAVFWETWISEKIIRENTRRGYEGSYRNYIGPFFDHQSLGRIDEHQILLFRKFLENRGLRESTINTYVDNICMCLKAAFRRGLIPEYPCESIRSLKEARPDIEPFSFDELRLFWIFCRKNFQTGMI